MNNILKIHQFTNKWKFHLKTPALPVITDFWRTEILFGMARKFHYSGKFNFK